MKNQTSLQEEAIQNACLKIYEAIRPVETTMGLINMLTQNNIINESMTIGELNKVLQQRMADYDLMTDQLKVQL